MMFDFKNKFVSLKTAFLFAGGSLFATPALAQIPAPDIDLRLSPVEPIRTIHSDTVYWSHPSAGATLKLWECPENGVCLQIHYLDPDDPAIRNIAAMVFEKNSEDITEEDIYSFCGFNAVTPEMNEESVDDGEIVGAMGKWKGKLILSYPGESYSEADNRGAHVVTLWLENHLSGTSLENIKDSLYLRIRKKFLWKGIDERTTFIRDKAPPPACSP